MSGKPGAPRLLHIHGSLAAGHPPAERCAKLIDAFGGRLRHRLVAADGQWSATEGVPNGVPIQRLAGFPQAAGVPLPGRLQRIAREMQDYDLVLTYGRGAIDAALAHTMFSELLSLPPLIHHEDGSDETPRQRRGFRSKWSRRIGLGKSAGVVVPGEYMEAAALVDWQQPLGRVKLIRDGVDLKRFISEARPDTFPRLLKRPGERWIGCFAPFGDEMEVAALLSAVAELDPVWHLILVNEGPSADRLRAMVSQRSLDHRVHLVAEPADRAGAMTLFDVVAVIGGQEPLPVAVIEAMAAAKPVVGVDPGDVRTSLSPDNGDAIMSGGLHGLASALDRLTADEFLRKRIGAANREKAEAERDEKVMIASYRRLYASAMKRDSI